MFGDYFQHDAHELLRCLLLHIDDAITGLRQFFGNAVSLMTKYPQQSSSALHRAVSLSSSPAAESSSAMLMSPLTLSQPSSLLTRAAVARRALSPHMNGDRQEADRRQQLSVTGHCSSLPSSPIHSLVVDLCMPRKCKSLVALPNISHQQLSCAVTVSPDELCDRLKRKQKSSSYTSLVVDLCMPRKCKSVDALQNCSQQQSSAAVTVSRDQLCDRLKRKRKFSWSSLTYHEHTPVKCKNLAFSCFGSAVDYLDQNCELATSSWSHNDSLRQMCTSVQQAKSSSELLMCSSGDCYPEDCTLAQLTEGAELVCDTSHSSSVSAVSIPVFDAHCSFNIFPSTNGHSSLNVKDQLLLSLQAMENGRSCYVSLCSEDINGLSPQTASHHSCTLKNAKNFTRSDSMNQHFARVRDMFGGQMLTQTKCLNCGSVASRSEPYEDIALFTGHCVQSRKFNPLLSLFQP